MAIDFEKRLRRHLTYLGSDPDAAGEVQAIRQLLCEHKRWSVYDGRRNGWVDSPKTRKNPGGCYCADCGINVSEADYHDK